MEKQYREIIKIEKNVLQFKYFVSRTEEEMEKIIVHPHWHDMTEILYVTKGEAVQHINDRIFKILKGDIVIIRSQDIHATYSEKNTDIEVYQFGNGFFDENNEQILSNFKIFTEDLLIENPINTVSATGADILEMIKSMKEEYISKEMGWGFGVISSYMNLIRFCLKIYPQKKVIQKNIIETKKFLNIVFRFIDENYKNKIFLKDVVELTQYSIPQFSRIFRKNVGMTFIEYLNKYRVIVSQDLLVKEMSITEIASECGYSSINSYIRAFRKQMRTSPGRYRRYIENQKERIY